MLYMPGSNRRALSKARGLPADALILDLEDAVAPQSKLMAREQVAEAAREGGYGEREVIVRINGFDTEWHQQDIETVAALPVHGILFPKVSSVQDAIHANEIAHAAGAGPEMSVWFMIETPGGILNIREICAAGGRLAGLIVGTSDLCKELRVPHTPMRGGLITALSTCVLAARAYRLAVLDGVHLNLADSTEFRAHCEQGRELGFDGKTLIHPSQIEVANAVFSPTQREVEQARAVLYAWNQALAAGEGVCLLNGRLIENLHADEARRVLDLYRAASGEV